MALVGNSSSRATIALLLLCAQGALADFGRYESHAVVGQALIVQTELGETSITAVDDAAFEVHYRENGVSSSHRLPWPASPSP